jgi:hypothetical protein
MHRLATTSKTNSHHTFLGMDDSSPEVRNLLTALMDKAISADEQGLDRAGDREISMALFGKHCTALCAIISCARANSSIGGNLN